MAFTTRLLFAALTLCVPLVAARAEDAPVPKAEPGVTAQSKCISEDTGWTGEGRKIRLVVQLTNTCEQRITCRVFVYATSAKGVSQGKGTLTLGPGAKGQETKKSWSMTVKMAGGSVQTARECRTL